jgi:hypothetical protein
MPIVKVGDRLIKFPDSMEKSEIRNILREKRSDFTIGIDAVTGPQAVFKRDPTGALKEEGQKEKDVTTFSKDDLKATIMIESGGVEGKDSPSGKHVGILQLSEVRAKELGVEDRNNPKQSIDGYMKHVEEANKALTKDGLDPSPLNAYILWQQGVTGGRDVLKGLDNPLKGFKREGNMRSNMPPEMVEDPKGGQDKVKWINTIPNPTVRDWYESWQRVFKLRKTASLDVDKFLA